MKDILDNYVKRGLLYSQVHPTLPLTIYNYTDKVQWECLWDDLTLMSRGLVVDNLGNIVARPFKKFFNLSENRTTVTSEYEIFDKLDGSLGILFFYAEQWIFASRGSFNSEQAVKGKEILDLKCDYNLLDKSFTYCFEIIYRENKIVVDYGDLESCVLTAVFNTSTGEEMPMSNMEQAKKYGFDAPLVELHKHIKDNEEGYVIRFSNGERCKIKGSEYLRLHKMMSEMSTTAIWNCLKEGDSILTLLEGYPDEWYNTVKEYEQQLLEEYKSEKHKIHTEFKRINNILGWVDDKVFALYIEGSPLKSFLFSLRKNKSIKSKVWDKIKPKYKRL
jgi:RNA ligase